MSESKSVWSELHDPWGKPAQKKPGRGALLTDKKLYVRFLEAQYNRVDSIAQLIERLPEPNEQIRVITQKSFNPFAILLYIVQHHRIEELFIAIYRIDGNSVEGLKKMVADGQIKTLTVVLSSFHRTSKKSEKWHLHLRDWARGNPDVRLIYCWNHAKVLAIKTDSDDYFVIEGSGNLSDNARIEQYLFENSRSGFDFHKDWMSDVYAFSAQNDVNEV